MLPKTLLASLALAAAAAAGGDAVGRYGETLAKVRAAKGRVSLADLYSDARAAEPVLRKQVIDFDEARAAGNDAVPEPTQPPGFIVSTDEALIAVPDPVFFDTLAQERGTDPDIAFFGMLRSAYDGPWPAWITQQTDVTGCTRFDSRVVDLYSSLAAGHSKWPAVYRDRQTEIRRDLEDALTSSTCLCDDEVTVRAGLKTLLEKFPKSPMAPALRNRLEKLETSKLRFSCVSG